MARKPILSFLDEQGVMRYQCGKCGCIFTADGFYKREGKPHSPCILCTAARVKKHYQEVRSVDPVQYEHMNEYSRERYRSLTPEQKKVINRLRRVNRIKRTIRRLERS